MTSQNGKERDSLNKSLLSVILICVLTVCVSAPAMADQASGQKASPDNGSSAGTPASADNESLAATPASAARQDPSHAGTWISEGGDWRYQLTDKTWLQKDWLLDQGKWYYLDEDGYMLTGMQRLKGKYYYFLDSGAMAVGWAYSEDEDCWYYMNQDGTRKTGWLSAGGAWYWFDSKGKMFHGGYRMVSEHKYYFFKNGQMAADQYVGLFYFGSDGLRDRRYDMVLQGKRRPSAEEKEAITEAMANIPRQWMKKFVESGWKFMYYTDKDYFSAPETDQGVYYVYHKTDTHYKKIKFTNPQSLAMAFGEYAAYMTGNDGEPNGFMADLQQYLTDSNMIQPLPSYFDDKISMWFGLLFQGYCDEHVRYDIRKTSPSLNDYMKKTLGVDFSGLKPSEEEWEEGAAGDEWNGVSGLGPFWDKDIGKAEGPAAVQGGSS